jgi:DNA replication protein
MKLTSDIIQIAKAGGGLRLDVSQRLTSDLVNIARVASDKKVMIFMTNANKKLTSDLISIANAGAGYVIFEDL